MVLMYLVIAIVALWGVWFRRPVDASLGLSIEQSTMVRGVFVLLVFASHVSQYLTLPDGMMTWSYRFIRSNLGQMIVVPFLFFSGYGVRCSILRKGENYVRSMPRKRILHTYVHTAVILLMFLTVQLFLGKLYSLKTLLLGFVFLESFGNSTWYLFAIIFLYAATWLSFRLAHSAKGAIWICFLFSAVYFIGLSLWKEAYWSDTVFVYTFGLSFPDLKELFKRMTARASSRLIGFLLLFAAFLMLTMSHFTQPVYGIMENVRAILFMLLILAALARFQVGNPVLRWLGKHVFLCYMLQRLPMIVLDHFGVSKTSIPIFVIGSAIGTAVLVLLVDKLLRAIDLRVFQR